MAGFWENHRDHIIPFKKQAGLRANSFQCAVVSASFKEINVPQGSFTLNK